MSNVRPYDSIPFVKRPPNHQIDLGPFLVSCYAEHGPIFRSTDFGNEVVYMVGPEANRFILANHRDLFSHRQGFWFVEEKLGKGLLCMDDPEHAQHRRMMNPAFTLSYIDHYFPIMLRVIRQRTADWAERGEVDLYEESRKITFDIATEALTGLQTGPEVDHFRDIFVRLLMLGMIAPNTEKSEREEFERREALLKSQLYELLAPKIEERRKKPTNDLLSMLVQPYDGQGNTLSNEQIFAHVNILLVAGHETSTSLNTWLLYLLTQHEDYLRRVLDEQCSLLAEQAEPNLESVKKMKVLENAISEAERLYPPIAHGPRGAFEDFEFNGYHVPAGSHVYYSIAASHLLSSIFSNPTQFDPDRFAPPREEHKKIPYALVGFGGGPRTCIGVNFAKVEIKVIASHILRNYQLTLVPGQEIVLFYRATATGMPLHGVRVRVSKH